MLDERVVGGSLRDLPRLRTSRRRRASSWDRTGGNDDRLTASPGSTAVLADIDGPGSISHIWCTAALPRRDAPDAIEHDYLRRPDDGHGFVARLDDPVDC